MVQAVLNRKHVAQLLACSVSTVDNLVRRGELSFTRRWSGGPKCFLFEHVEELKRKMLARSKTGGGGRNA
jgi:excisionase family DNA binding protein